MQSILEHTRGRSRYSHRRQPPPPPDYRNPAYRLYLEEHIDKLKEIVRPDGSVLRLKPSHRAVLKQICRYQKQSGECYAGHATIGEQVRLSRRTVCEACGDLRDAGVLDVKRRGRRLKNGRGGRTTNLVAIVWDHPCWKDCRLKPSFRKGPAPTCKPRLSELSAQHNLSASSQRDYVNSAGFKREPPESVATATTETSRDTAVDTEKPQPTAETKEKQASPTWTVAILGALILRLIGVQLGAVSLEWILRTVGKRKLNEFEPECVVRTIAEDLSTRNSFASARPDLFRDPGAVIHAAAKRIDPAQVAEKIDTKPLLEFTASTLDHAVERSQNQQNSTNLVNRATHGEAADAAYAALRRKHEQRPVETKPPPPTIDQAQADEMVRSRGIDPDVFYDEVWKITQRPIWMHTAEQWSRVIDCYQQQRDSSE